jgi:transposase
VIDSDEARKILQNEAEARVRLKTERARLYLAEIDRGTGSTVAWQKVALATADLEREAEMAKAERFLLWMEANFTPPEEES